MAGSLRSEGSGVTDWSEPPDLDVLAAKGRDLRNLPPLDPQRRLYADRRMLTKEEQEAIQSYAPSGFLRLRPPQLLWLNMVTMVVIGLYSIWIAIDAGRMEKGDDHKHIKGFAVGAAVIALLLGVALPGGVLLLRRRSPPEDAFTGGVRVLILGPPLVMAVYTTYMAVESGGDQGPDKARVRALASSVATISWLLFALSTYLVIRTAPHGAAWRRQGEEYVGRVKQAWDLKHAAAAARKKAAEAALQGAAARKQRLEAAAPEPEDVPQPKPRAGVGGLGGLGGLGGVGGAGGFPRFGMGAPPLAPPASPMPSYPSPAPVAGRQPMAGSPVARAGKRGGGKR